VGAEPQKPVLRLRDRVNASRSTLAFAPGGVRVLCYGAVACSQTSFICFLRKRGFTGGQHIAADQRHNDDNPKMLLRTPFRLQESHRMNEGTMSRGPDQTQLLGGFASHASHCGQSKLSFSAGFSVDPLTIDHA